MTLADVIGRAIDLTPTVGGDYTGLCPWCNAALPTLTLFSASQHFHCTNCGVSGDAFTWAMKRYGLTFPQALRLLTLMSEG